MKQGRQAEGFLVGAALCTSALAFAATAQAEGADLSLGKSRYEAQDGCVVCHGADGKGDGPAAQFLFPKPRDFTSGIFKIHSTPFLPTDDDLLRTISNGMPGTLMPSFTYLSLEERRALVTYVESFSDRFEAESEEPVPIPDPPDDAEELLPRGEELYKQVRCDMCHGPLGKGDGPSASTLVDSWGNPIVPYDFTIPGRMKGGSTPKDLYRTLMVGIGGTPMPSYAEAIVSEEDRWALVFYVLSLSEDAEPSLPSGHPDTGKELFTGIVPFENGSAPCIGCHSISGIGALGGGVLGPDLSVARDKYGDDKTADILSTFPFPTMNPIYSAHPLTADEQTDLRAFLMTAVPVRPPEMVYRLFVLALLGAAVLLLATHLLWRRRLSNVRRAMVEVRT